MWEAIISGVTLGCILALSVGPVIFTVIKQSLTNGYVGGFSFVTGVWVSDLVLIVVSNGFSSLVTTLLEYKHVIGYVGSSFLVITGIYYLFFKKVSISANCDDVSKFSKKTMMKIFSSGFLINTLNPSVLIFWLGAATAFSAKYNFQERIIIFSVCLLVNIAADSAKVLLAGKLRKRLTLNTLSVVNKVSGIILVGFGIALLYGTIFYANQILNQH
ncbi:LysE family translocator [Gynurincola endophyticus]|jgi:threonine/homoserine/homoserine lactone efflux protein|uniref:LysE family translocator n=1 Tax=Gynurincola endophyticus TaxID=2479004 RepID=UPI000F8D3733|nr:LysE family translocator [Gynurincola endophyticus]